MSGGSILDRRRCTCNYKCRHSPLGAEYVSTRVFYYHLQHDINGNIHPSVRQRREDTTMPTETSNQARKVWCNCSSYCAGGRMVHPRTFSKHKVIQMRLNNILSKWGFSSSDHGNGENASCGGISHDFESNDDAYHEETTIEDHPNEHDIHVDDIPRDTTNEEVTRSRMEESEHMTLQDEIIERCIELQALWDTYQTPIQFQDEMLHILFGDMKGSKDGRSRGTNSKPSLSKLLVQLPSTWNGDLNGVQIPTCWRQLMKLYSGLGMHDVQRFRMCTGTGNNPHAPQVFQPSVEDNYAGHVLYCLCGSDTRKTKKLKRDCVSCCEKCTQCRTPRKDMVLFDYAPIASQLQFLSKSRTVCHEFLRMWRNRERWLGKLQGEHPDYIQEFWDGEKCRELQSFWDPNSSFELPIICEKSFCKKVFATYPTKCQLLQNAWNEDREIYDFLCTGCRSPIQCKKNICKGDPRNFAFLLHTDGFQASRTTQKDCYVVEIKILNAGNYSTQEILPVLFIPLSCKKLIRTVDDAFSSFLQPLVAELEYLFLEGFDLFYNYPPSKIVSHSSIVSKNCHLRGILMMVTGDHPAQCKIGLFKSGGQAFCRRDTAKATLEQRVDGFFGRYVFDGNRYQARYPPSKRSTSEMVDALTKSKRSHVQYEKEEILRSKGLSGESILWRLYNLYAFDLRTDLVYDVMHILSLNLFRKYISIFMKECTNEVKKEIDVATSEIFKAAPNSIKYGRWPRFPSKYHASYKAEENQKFIQWCLPYILTNVVGVSKIMHELGLLLIDIAHIFYNYSRDHGWSKHGLDAARSLLLAWRVRSEEYYGPNSSPLEHVAGNGEMLDDIYRHGNHDVYWCYDFERKVSTYVNITTNSRSNEISFTQFFRRRLFISTYEGIQVDKDGLMPYQRMLESLHSCLVLPDGYVLQTEQSFTCCPSHLNGILEVSSVSKARYLWKTCITLKHGFVCEELLLTKGIAIRRKQKEYRTLKEEEKRFAEQFWQIERNCGHFTHVTIYKKILFAGELYAIGDYVVVKADDNNVEHTIGHWKARINSLFSMQSNGQFMIFFGADYYRQCIVVVDEKQCLKIEPTSGMSVLQKTHIPFDWNCIRPISSLLHKFIPFSYGSELIAYETKDLGIRERLLALGFPGCVPPWLEEHDIVLVQCHSENFQHSVIRYVDSDQKRVKLTWIKKLQNQNGIWKIDKEEINYIPWDNCVKVLKNWHAIKHRRVNVNGITKHIPIVWQDSF